MKTKPDFWNALIMLAIACTLSGNVSAQSDPDHTGETDLYVTVSELELFVIHSENSIRYKAPMDDYDETPVLLEPLEILAEKFSNNLKYHAPDFGVLKGRKPVSRELITQKKNSENEYSKNQSL